MDKGGQVDTFILDFEKAFDTLPHELLKCKLYGYGIGWKTLKWIDSFLCDRQQHVMVNGVKSDWAPVLSGVPQGTVLGPLLFSFYINDITEDIDSELRLFADNCVCYREIKATEDTVKLQEDIEVVYLWGFYDIKFKLTQYKSKLGLIPQYTFDLREFDITNLKFGSNTTIYLAQHVTLTNYKPKPGLIPQHTKQTSLY